ncbi:MAG: hypothetical protein SV062_03595 [Thermodesulfobacteriota bacterium]|nr:hypothetical protein [Thermodesulfobacteriota bacterium]
MKLRHYGFLNPNSGLSIEKTSELITLIYDVIQNLLPKIPFQGNKKFRCLHCGHDLKFLAFIKPIPVWRSSGLEK